MDKECIKAARRAKGMTQAELAEAIGVTCRTVQNYETGTKVPKKQETLSRLCEVLDIDESELFGSMPCELSRELSPGIPDFADEAQKEYGSRGRRQAEEVIRNFRVAAAGGELSDEDLDFIREAMMQTYWDAKRYNRRFGRKQSKDGVEQ